MSRGVEMLSDSISIHALRGEGDLNLFQWNYIIDGISIHALRGEGDKGIMHLIP